MRNFTLHAIAVRQQIPCARHMHPAHEIRDKQAEAFHTQASSKRFPMIQKTVFIYSGAV
jgi:hypothetical protein